MNAPPTDEPTDQDVTTPPAGTVGPQITPIQMITKGYSSSPSLGSITGTRRTRSRYSELAKIAVPAGEGQQERPRPHVTLPAAAKRAMAAADRAAKAFAVAEKAALAAKHAEATADRAAAAAAAAAAGMASYGVAPLGALPVATDGGTSRGMSRTRTEDDGSASTTAAAGTEAVRGVVTGEAMPSPVVTASSMSAMTASATVSTVAISTTVVRSAAMPEDDEREGGVKGPTGKRYQAVATAEESAAEIARATAWTRATGMSSSPPAMTAAQLTTALSLPTAPPSPLNGVAEEGSTDGSQLDSLDISSLDSGADIAGEVPSAEGPSTYSPLTYDPSTCGPSACGPSTCGTISRHDMMESGTSEPSGSSSMMAASVMTSSMMAASTRSSMPALTGRFESSRGVWEDCPQHLEAVGEEVPGKDDASTSEKLHKRYDMRRKSKRQRSNALPKTLLVVHRGRLQKAVCPRYSVGQEAAPYEKCGTTVASFGLALSRKSNQRC